MLSKRGSSTSILGPHQPNVTRISTEIIPRRSNSGLLTPRKDWIKALPWDSRIPWRFFAFPIIEFAAFVMSWSASSFLAINLTQSQNFAAPPYKLFQPDGRLYEFCSIGWLPHQSRYQRWTF